MRFHHITPIGILGVAAGLAVIYLSLRVMSASWRQFGEGHFLRGCCLWELSDDLFGCGMRMMGCGSVLALLALPLLALIGWLRHH